MCFNFIAYRLSDDKFLGQLFRNKVYNKGPTLTIMSANNGNVFGGYSPISWTEGTDENWKTSHESFLFTITDNKGRQPEKLKIEKKRRTTALFHSRISYAFGSGHDLCINLIDLKRSESSLFTYNIPKGSTTDANRYLAGRKDNWDVQEFEVFLLQDPIKMSRYEIMTNSLHYMAKAQLISEGISTQEIEWVPTNHIDQAEDSGGESPMKDKPYIEDDVIEGDSILDHSFLYKNLVKDEHLMTKAQLTDLKRQQHQKRKSFMNLDL